MRVLLGFLECVLFVFGCSDGSDPDAGVDYLLAYWMGRYYGFITDDTAGKCLAWH